MNKLLSTLPVAISIIIAVATVAVISILGLQRADQYLSIQETQARSEAIDGCAQVSLNTFGSSTNGQNSTISDINQTTYQKCLELKGIVAK